MKSKRTAFRSSVVQAFALALCLLVLGAGAARAEPLLQLYVPDGTYDEATETWVSYQSNFQLWLLAAYDQNKAPIYNAKISVAIRDSQWDTPGSDVGVSWVEDTVHDLFVDGLEPLDWADPIPTPFEVADDGNALAPHLTFDGALWDDSEAPEGQDANYRYGIPYLGDPAEGQTIAPHGTYSDGGAYYTELNLGDLHTESETDTDLIGDATSQTEDEWSKKGIIYKFDISVTGFTHVYFDAHNGYEQANGAFRAKFAPYSHNAAHLPEPGSVAFVGVVLAGVVAQGIRRRRRRRG